VNGGVIRTGVRCFRCGTGMVTADERNELVGAVREARRAAEGDSNDNEIAALHLALDNALQLLGIDVPEED
jgi:hypothetical protein